MKPTLVALAVVLFGATACSSDSSPQSSGEVADDGALTDDGAINDDGAMSDDSTVDDDREVTDVVREAMEELGLGEFAAGMTDDELIAEGQTFCQIASEAAAPAPLDLDILQAEILQYAATHTLNSELSAGFVGVLLAAFCPTEMIDEVRDAMKAAGLGEFGGGMTDDELVAEAETFCQMASGADDVNDLEAPITEYATSNDLGVDLAATFVGVLLATFCPTETGRLGLLG